ncbi:MAG: amino acid decarboxylase [Ignavibacteria bacterium]|nr:amino acid decarboxylase [Ignavibacteria bacterium]
MKNSNELPVIGDMRVDEFRKYGHQLVEWIANYLEGIENYKVLPDIKPGEIKSNLPSDPPQKSEPLEIVMKDFEDKIIPGITHWNHPDFMAYFNSTSSGPGILAELLSAGLNVNGMAWHTCPAATELEEVTLSWFKKMLALPDNLWGIIYDTASVSSLHAIAAAREQLNGIMLREKGLSGRNDVPRLRLYFSEQAHFSIYKSAVTLGIGLEGIGKIPVDKDFKMIPSELQKALNEDRKDGWLPFCVVTTVGTTSTTSVDPVKDISKICLKENLWLHVDAAYAGSAAVLPEMRWIFDGIENADSLVINPHKWMFTPIDLSIFYTKKPEVLKRAFSLRAEYLKASEKESTNFMDYGIQLGRRFRALKLWFIIKHFGVEGIRKRIKEHIRLAKEFAEWIDAHSNFERMAPTDFGVVCFRAHPKNINDEDKLNILNEILLNKINESGKLYLSHTKLNGKYVIRISISGLRTFENHVNSAKELIQEKVQAII